MSTDFAQAIARSAIGFRLSGARPTGHLLESWFGKVTVCAKEEHWPLADGVPMIPLLQLNLSEIDDLPIRLQGIVFLTMFIHPTSLPDKRDPNGTNWCIRTYSSLDQLVPIAVPKHQSHIQPFPLLPYHIPVDYPGFEDCPVEIPEELDGSYSEHYQTVPGIKLGGWPYLIQSEIYWAPMNQHPSEPEYVLQIDSVPKANWAWGHDGVAYLGLGTAPGRTEEWWFTWQSL